MGAKEGALSFAVIVDEVREGSFVQFRWGEAGALTTVQLTVTAVGAGRTHLRIEETGFGGDQGARFHAALQSTKGFNQLVIAAKAFVERWAAIKIVTDHIA